MNIDKYLNNTEQTMNGVVFKDRNAFEKKEGICYIGEYGLEELERLKEEGVDVTDEDILEYSIGSTYASIKSEVEERWEDFDDEIKEECSIEDIVEDVFESSDWTFISTTIDQMTY